MTEGNRKGAPLLNEGNRKGLPLLTEGNRKGAPLRCFLDDPPDVIEIIVNRLRKR
jgi:hypothetical protein